MHAQAGGCAGALALRSCSAAHMGRVEHGDAGRLPICYADCDSPFLAAASVEGESWAKELLAAAKCKADLPALAGALSAGGTPVQPAVWRFS